MKDTTLTSHCFPFCISLCIQSSILNAQPILTYILHLCFLINLYKYIILSDNNWLTLPVVRSGTARQLHGAPTYKHCQDVNWNNHTHAASNLRFPHAKEFIWKLSAIWAHAVKNVCQNSARVKKFKKLSVLRSAKLLTCLGRPHLSAGPAWGLNCDINIPLGWPPTCMVASDKR